MITDVLKTGQTWQGQKMLYTTELFGKTYFWLQDGDGTLYLAKMGDNGLPSLS